MSIKKIKFSPQIKGSHSLKIKSLSNEGENQLKQINNVSNPLLPTSEKISAEKFSGLKRYLKRSI